jgi:hypothetical protein
LAKAINFSSGTIYHHSTLGIVQAYVVNLALKTFLDKSKKAGCNDIQQFNAFGIGHNKT